jgi:hypothetical protein
VVTALFHDAGYIRQTDDQTHRNGAEFTLSHVSRSAHFIGRYLPTIGMAEWVPVATKIVHFTGYEVQFDQIRLDDHRDRKLGHLIGTGDLIAQMADRCYLEKCRDRLYPEFVLGGIAMPSDSRGKTSVRYNSGLGRAAAYAGVRRRRAAARASTASSAPPYRISIRCSTAATRTWKRSSATSTTSKRCCAPALADAPARSAVLHLGAQPGAEHPLAGHRAPEAGVEEQLISRLGAALAVGLLIGIERERSKGQGPRRAAAGVRTFTLIALAGAISLELGGLPAFLVVAAVIGVFAAISYVRTFRHDAGLTTEVAMVVTVLLGGSR